jgi:pimeloyl-ACP methyl ester carboxylesterase
MRRGTWLAVSALSVTLAARPAAALTLDAAEPVTIKGAHGLFMVPAGWKPETGGLFIYAHGYTADPRTIVPYPADITGDNLTTKLTGGDVVLQIPLNLGYATATTTYRSVGWAVGDAVKDIENLRRAFVHRFGQPHRTYIIGHSEGGMVTQAVAEIAAKHYDGALPFCAPGAGGRRNFTGAFDLRAVFEYVCRDVPESRFVCRVCSGGSACVDDGDCPGAETCGGPEAPPRPEDGLTPACADFLLAHPEKTAALPGSGDFIGRKVEACFGGAAPTAAQAARKDLFLRTTRIPESFIGTDMFFASVGLAEVFYERTGRKHGWSNALVDYAAPGLTPAEQTALNNGVPRAIEDASGVRYMRRFFEPHARTGAKVLALHAIDDGLVLVENQEKYREAFTAAGRDDQLVQLYTSAGGHCGFTGAEHLAVFLGLTSWVDMDVVPTLAATQAVCTALEAIAGGPCRFIDYTPAEWGTRVVERRQQGAPPSTLVCDGDAEDCPDGTTCDAGTHTCRER